MLHAHKFQSSDHVVKVLVYINVHEFDGCVAKCTCMLICRHALNDKLHTYVSLQLQQVLEEQFQIRQELSLAIL